MSEDEVKNKEYFCNEISESNSFNPTFDSENFSFKILYPEFCFLIIQVWDSVEKSIIGWYSIPIDCVGEGYKIIPLMDDKIKTIESSFIFAKIVLN